MTLKLNHVANRWSNHTSPWIIIGSVVILFIVVIVLATQNYSREKKYTSRILSEKGIALIKAIEAGTRTGITDVNWGKEQFQSLLEETAQLPNVLFLALINSKGIIFAHSDKSQIGEEFRQNQSTMKLYSSTKPSWQVYETDEYGRLFLVYNYFEPTEEFSIWMNKEGMYENKKKLSQDINLNLSKREGISGGFIVVALNPKPFDEALKEDIRNSVVISVVLIILAFAGFISMFWMHNYRSTKKELQDSTTFANEVTKSLPVGLIATDKDGTISYFNGAAERITGIEPSNMLGKSPSSVLPYDLCGLKDKLNLGETIFEEEMECEFVQGKLTPVSVSASEIINEEGHFVAQILILRELGEVRRLQSEIRRAEKMAAIGDLAAGVAHEIRNPLSSIKGIASYYKSKFTAGSEDKEMASVMIEEVDRLSRVITELLEFARPTKLNVKLTNLNELLQHSILLVQQEASLKKIHIEFNIISKAIIAEIDPDRLIQCFLNLYLNAFQAMEDGGKLTIGVLVTNDNFVQIDVSDTGSGIHSQDLTKIFDPYFTSKPQGTGLGLAVVHKIIEAHQGLIKVRSTYGNGCVFSIFLPMNNNNQ